MRLADEVLILQGGRTLQSGPAMEVYRRPASLAAALALGPASQVRGEVRGGNLVSEGAVVIEDLSPLPAGPTVLLLRPEDVRFHPEASASARVRGCEWSGGRYRLAVQTAAGIVLAYSDARHSEGAAGRLRFIASNGAAPAQAS